MDSSLGALGRLFSSDGFVPRRVCGLWPDWLVWEHVGGNALVWIAYVAMPLIIWRLGTRRPDWTPFKGLVFSFALFIGLCGLGHFLDMLAFYHPMYRLSGHVLVATGLASCWTAWSLRRAWPALMAMRSPAELERVIAERTGQLALALERLGEKEARFRELADAMPQMVWTTRADGRADYYNRRWYDYMGRGAAEGGDESWLPFLHPDDVRRSRDLFYRAVETGEPYEVKYRFRDHRTGEYRWHLGRGLPVKDASGRVLRWIGTCTDIHEGQLQAEALRRGEERQKLARTAARIGHWEWEIPDDRITHVESLPLLYGRGDDRPFADYPEYLASVHPDDRKILDDAVGRTLTTGAPFEAEYRLTWPDGSVRWLASRGTLISSPDGTPLRMAGVNLDITDRKESEAEILRLNEGLERRVVERTAEVVAATAALLEAERRFRAIFDSTFQFIGLLSPEGILREANQTALDFVRMRREDVVGRPFWETPWWTHSEESRERNRRAVAEAAQGRFVRYEEEFYGPDGEVATFDFSLKPILDESGRVVMLIPEGRDITERKRAEEEQESRATIVKFSLASLVESSDDAIIGKDLDGVVTSWNRGAERIFGYTAAEAVGRPLTFLFPPDRMGEEVEILERVRGGLSVDRFESVRLARDGRSIDVSLTISPIKDRSGRVVGISKIARDITEQKQAEAKARLVAEELERLFGQRTEELRQRIRLIDQAQDAILVRSGTGVISSWNRGAERLYGWTREEAVGRTSHELLGARFPATLAEIEGELASLGVWEGELIHRRRDGARVVVASRWVLDRDGTDEEAVLEINSDITERKLSIQRLKDSDSRTQAILDAAADAILTIDERGLVESVNPAAERLFGHPTGELIGQDIERLMPGPHHGEHEDHPANDREPGLRKVIDIGRDVVGRRKDGTTFPMHLAMSELRLGERRMFTVIARDITEREEVEVALRDARDAAMAGSRAKSEFLANMSHEIRTPMNGVLGMTELLLVTPLSDLQRNYARTIHDSGEALLTVIDDILDFSKIEAGKLTLKSTEFDLRELMDELADLLAPGVTRKGLRMSCRVDGEVPRRLVGDPVRLRQILTNLAGNAVKFTERGEVVLEARLVIDDGAGAMVRIMVRDTGIGIPEDRRADVFESFTQVEGSNRREHGGTGLGLAICQRLVALMGGRIGLESRVGEGSTFWFEVTLGKVAGEAGRPASRLEGLRVLVIEEQQADREALREMLLSWECRPEVVASAAEALSGLMAGRDDGPFGLILLAREMAGMGGEQVARVIRAVPGYAEVPLVLLTEAGPAGPEATEGGPWAARMAKPIRRSLLYNILSRTVEVPDLLPDRPPAGDPRMTKLASPPCILLAEDNEVNRAVAAGMLERLGCRVEAVWNGREAVEALDYGRHDLILMDVQMPEMDGFAATAEIRGRERGAGRRVPIIALTAHAMEGDRARCLAAGMDDYLSKPIRPGPLVEALRAWGGRAGPAPVGAVPCPGPEVPSAFGEGLRASCGGDPGLIRKVAEVMLKGVPARLGRLGAAILAGDWGQVSGESHSLKGAFATVGARDLAAACQELMALGGGEDPAAIEGVHRRVRGLWAGLEREASRYLETPRP